VDRWRKRPHDQKRERVVATPASPQQASGHLSSSVIMQEGNTAGLLPITVEGTADQGPSRATQTAFSPFNIASHSAARYQEMLLAAHSHCAARLREMPRASSCGGSEGPGQVFGHPCRRGTSVTLGWCREECEVRSAKQLKVRPPSLVVAPLGLALDNFTPPCQLLRVLF
jgi:hypothetical protein